MFALGGVLLQKDPNTNRTHPIAYLSKKYTDTQRRYSNAEREMLALTYTVNYFREFTLGRQTTVYTDCQALQYYKNFKNTSSRLNRLALSLVDYDIIVKYKKGSNNLLADSLSRNPVDENIDEDMLEVALNIKEVQTENFEELQEKDPYFRAIKLAKISPDQVDRKIRRDSRLYEEKDGLLYYKSFNGTETKYLLAIPQVKIPEILKAFHDNHYSGGHFSDYKTLARIKLRYYWLPWPKMSRNIPKRANNVSLRGLTHTKAMENYNLRYLP